MRAFAFAISIATLVSPMWAQDLPPVDLAQLRADVKQRLLLEQDVPIDQVIDHVWKSNGGAAIPRTPTLLAATELATNLSSRIEYDPETGTVFWPVVGFADPRSVRFTPESLWLVVSPYFQTQTFTDNDLARLETNFVTLLQDRPVVVDPLVPPTGLTMPAGDLLCVTGYFGTSLFVYSPANCFALAQKCYNLGLYVDARVLLSHALAQQIDPRFYYVRGTIEMLTGLPIDARLSAHGFLASAVSQAPFVGYTYERVNGPAAIQFRDLTRAIVRY